MASPLALRIDEKTRRRIARIARRKGLSSSEVIREAIDAWTAREEPAALPFAAISDLLGVVRGGNPKRSQQGGARFAELLRRRRSRS
jgi:predicted DNA-binding protein